MGSELEAKVRKWGNSYGLLVSKKDAARLGIREHQTLRIKVEKTKNPLEEMYGKISFSKPTKQLLKEARENFSKWGL